MLYYALSLPGLFWIASSKPITVRDTNDKCGPTLQNDPNNPIDTCVTPVRQVSTPNAYGVFADTDPKFTLSPGGVAQPYVARDWYTGCEASIEHACDSLATAPNGTWSWSDQGPYCLVGYYLPDITGAAVRPSKDHCIRDILNPMIMVMADVTTPLSSKNRASVNLNADLPEEAWFPVRNSNETGVAVNSGYASWVVQG